MAGGFNPILWPLLVISSNIIHPIPANQILRKFGWGLDDQMLVPSRQPHCGRRCSMVVYRKVDKSLSHQHNHKGYELFQLVFARFFNALSENSRKYLKAQQSSQFLQIDNVLFICKLGSSPPASPLRCAVSVDTQCSHYRRPGYSQRRVSNAAIINFTDQ